MLRTSRVPRAAKAIPKERRLNVSLSVLVAVCADATASNSNRQSQEEFDGVVPADFFSDAFEQSFSHVLHICEMPKPIKHFKREVRRARHLSAWIKVQGRTIAECQVMDISNNGAKIVTAISSGVPDHFQLIFFQGDQTRSCDVIWRHDKVFGVKFAL